MKKYIKYLVATIIVILIWAILIVLNTFNTTYDKLTVVENKATALNFLNTSIPKKIAIYTNFYSKTVITNKLDIDEILDSINVIRTSSLNKNKIVESDNSSYTVNGKIFYNNNKIDNFSLNNKLIFNNKTYNGSSYLINTLHRKLFNYFNTYEHLIDILRTKSSSVEHIEKELSFFLDDKGKENLAKKLTKLEPMDDKSKLNETSIKDKKLYTMKIKINKDLKYKTNNLIFMDVYKNYVIIEFLAEDNGKKSIWRKP
ncbi:DUF3919 family protein [Clostridium botulinum]|uniref:DUF3919 family protein n=1 Tax=Clostridium botulinum TaxID=1491 RepID=UPI0004D88EC7|nr:DUF3919 family protein [Clostridium botulinum]KEH96731.1 hypothetical protein Z953_14005 [Clostridium botulinum D str. 16868]KLU74567.1 hypothetical protein CBC3_13610 [Clostridium botulinum V891]KOA73261.1 hypothetical protein ADU78_13045 [Clostridium botulinum]KOA91189.1 hypothetical protein ADU76_11840 [Clostridium botulinum]KOC32916.1 hypothetical protein ADU81_10530 [Clostridium botulinum]